MKQKGLGRGLDAIFGSEHLDARLKPMTEMAEISVSAIFPNPCLLYTSPSPRD